MKYLLVCLLLASTSFAEGNRKLQVPDAAESHRKWAETRLRIVLMDSKKWPLHGEFAILACPKRGEALITMMMKANIPALFITRYAEDEKKCEEESRALSKQIDAELRQVEEKDKKDIELWCKEHPNSEYSRYCNN